tara:strand:- start:1067 stop:1291 length:225 start_codon:yes stop_codon:yes gene_type:complete
MEKTFKREVAILLLLWLGYVVEVKDAEIIQILVWPIFSFVAAAFGFDAYSKLQRNPPEPPDGRGTERSSQHPDR